MSQLQYFEHKSCRLAYRVQGEGTPVVFIQGTGVHGDGWQPQIDAFMHDYACLSFDNRGMAKSQASSELLSVELMMSDTLALMNHLGWQKAHIVGHSLGGLIALALALNFPNKIKSLALLCSFSRGKDATKLNPWLLQIGMRMRIGTAKYRRRAFVDMVMPSMPKEEKDKWAKDLAAIFGYDLAQQPKIVYKQLKAMNNYDASPHLDALRGLPSLVLAASEDKVAPPKLGKDLAQRLDAPYYEIANAAHGVTISHANEVNTYLLDFHKKAENLT